MKRYSIFHPLVLSFFSKSLYRDVGQYWRGTGLAYLLLVLALVWIPTMIKAQSGLEAFVDHDSKKFTDQLPPITISKGKVSTDVTTPYFMKSPDGTTFMIIDTTGEYQNLDNTTAQALLTKTKLIMRQSTNETRVYDLSNIDSFSLSGPRVDNWLLTGKHWFIPVGYPLMVAFAFAFRTVQILIYALIGMLFASMLQVKLDYQGLMRLAAIAITPVLILNLVLEFVPVHIPLWSILGVAVALGYLFLAVKWNGEPDEVIPEEQAPWARPPALP
jgi:hypothetical protein